MSWLCPWRGHGRFSCTLFLLQPSRWQCAVQIQQRPAQLLQQRQQFYMGLATIWIGNVRKNQVLWEAAWVI